jgi:hypothetical protein
MFANVLWLAFSGVTPTPSHYKYNKTFHSAADFPAENPEVAIEANRGCTTFLYSVYNSLDLFQPLQFRIAVFNINIASSNDFVAPFTYAFFQGSYSFGIRYSI